ncbi:hypothetical protein CBP34_18605 [Acidovorax carolinensis]|uniref:Pilus assembly protein n=1 Tax=Acidovorax carolinensis TaxID=553814 RepID=A0A240U601_9BURK|nr:hypothetical protein CBP34_18605 [Acidovorax carolinensis]
MLVLVALLVFALWFPSPLGQLAGGLRLFWTIVGVDLVCGPLLTLLLYRSTKTRLALAVDYSLIALLQLAALAYGLQTLAHARPLAQVFEVDRFRLVSYADIAEPDVQNLPPWAQPWRAGALRTLGLREAESASERLQSFGSSLSGVDAGQWPSRWQDYAMNRKQVRERSKTLAALRAAHPTYVDVIEKAVAEAMANIEPGETREADNLRWLPLVSRTSLDWVVLLDPQTLRIRAYAPLDGF